MCATLAGCQLHTEEPIIHGRAALADHCDHDNERHSDAAAVTLYGTESDSLPDGISETDRDEARHRTHSLTRSLSASSRAPLASLFPVPQPRSLPVPG